MPVMKKKEKSKISQFIRRIGLFLIIGVTGSINGIGIAKSLHDLNIRSDQLREDQNEEQKIILKHEVEKVSVLINEETEKKYQEVKSNIKDRSGEAYLLVHDLYEKNKDLISEKDLQKMILDALNSVSYTDGKGYYFVLDLKNNQILSKNITLPPGRGENTGQNITLEDFYINNVEQAVKANGEGFYEYEWSKPGDPSDVYKKISYIKLFEPYQWILGTGLYFDDFIKDIDLEILSSISRIRFGKEGYIFVNRLNGDALVSNGMVFSGSNKLWEEFDSDPDKMEAIFRQGYDASQVPGGDYIYYSHIKLTTPEKESSKISFILGIPDKEWLVGAGAYLDDIEDEVAILQDDLKGTILDQIIFSLIVSFVVFILFQFFHKWLNQKLRTDTSWLIAGFEKAAYKNELIDRDKIHFYELDKMAESVNLIINDKTKTEIALLDSEKRFRDLVENSSDWIWEFDENEKITYASPSIKDILGYSPEELSGRFAFELTESEKRKKVQDEFFQYKEKREAFFHLENRSRHKDGSEVILESSGVPVVDTQGNFRGYRGIDRDITQRIHLEEQLRQAHKMEAIGNLAGGIAHDFNNILSAILGYAELALLRLPKEDRAYNYINEILRSGSRAADLVSHILAYSRKEPSDIVPVSVSQAIKDTVSLLRASIPANIEIRIEIDSRCGNILANRTELHQVILNLCTNGCQAMEGKDGVLKITLDRRIENEARKIRIPDLNEIPRGKYVQLTISDNGPGIDPHLVNKIFDPYFTTKDASKGSGMGLAIVKGIVISFGGYIEIENIPGKGASFHLYFPEVKLQEEKEEAGPKNWELKLESDIKILVLDDEEDILVILGARLEQLGYSVLSSSRGDEALEFFNKDPSSFDLIITDQSMPGMTGEEFVREIRKIRSEIPIIMCTGYSSQMDMEKAEKLGINAFLMKPVKLDDLAIAINDALAKK